MALLQDSLSKKLDKLGYKIENLQDLFDSLPKAIFTSHTANKIIRKPTIYLIVFENNRYSLSLAFKDDDGELSVLEKFTSENLAEVLSRMILFLHQSGLLSLQSEDYV